MRGTSHDLEANGDVVNRSYEPSAIERASDGNGELFLRVIAIERNDTAWGESAIVTLRPYVRRVTGAMPIIAGDDIELPMIDALTLAKIDQPFVVRAQRPEAVLYIATENMRSGDVVEEWKPSALRALRPATKFEDRVGVAIEDIPAGSRCRIDAKKQAVALIGS